MINQNKEFYGHFSKETYDFKDSFSPEYNTFILNLRKNDAKYVKSKTIEERIDLSQDSNKLWNEYILYEKKFVPSVIIFIITSS